MVRFHDTRGRIETPGLLERQSGKYGMSKYTNRRGEVWLLMGKVGKVGSIPDTRYQVRANGEQEWIA